ncbi:F-box-like protein [Ceratobasidium sp. AG-Ba]|nr:F-box-like protein [Ceratobasidium sp. AG-Ba]
MAAAPEEFRDWYKAADSLSIAVQTYLDACLALESFIALRFASTASSTTHEDTLFAAVLLEQKSVELRNTKLERGDISVKRVHNLSKKLVPIRSLPDEIMARIFALTFDKCTFLSADRPPDRNRRCFRALLTINKVCSNWRRIALGNPLLWNHVDMVDRGTLNDEAGTTGLWLERAIGTQLSIQVSIDRDVEDCRDRGSFRWLLPYFGSVSSLALLHFGGTKSLHKALEYWWDNGSPGSVKDLTVYGPQTRGLRDQFKYLEDTSSFTKDTINSFLSPVQTLRLRHVLFGWSSEAYRGLKHLDISHTPQIACPTQRNISDIFIASPGLHYLRLHLISIKADSAGDVISPQDLNALHTLEIIGLGKNPVSDFFPLFRANLTELSLGIDGHLIGKLATNCALVPSNITRLCIKTYSTGYHPGIGKQLLSLPLSNLRVLAFEFVQSAGEYWRNTFFGELLPTPRSDSEFASPWRVNIGVILSSASFYRRPDQIPSLPARGLSCTPFGLMVGGMAVRYSSGIGIGAGS